MIGTLTTVPALDRPDLLAAPVRAALDDRPDGTAYVAEIDPGLADTAEFCAAYDVAPEISANCVVVAGKRGDDVRIAACMVLATTRADVNNVVRRRLDARKASFLPMDDAVAATGMEYGGITPLGLPTDWPILVDTAVAALPFAVVGSGVRHSKLAVPGEVLSDWPGAEVVDGLGVPMRSS
ncbi:prolyl-tRNA editing enzyme YbaK/EbsC (Cys-tRNA(Pro) deacylase) [Haloactinopolyspora alba]|uniref:Prolyl-tRNA editing enzyme YbaK/EbsC (Cys-tRNA(Pro) deacylase) n=1 Tax=Haloactinopolyspora alba TaxID=648780 RepID=A0A2P8DHG7_9ACTN|nr:prolyl-tRNA editing enzyme YbaK/EbsC (Cys-tRNA(Pro) deacylase) [Haloactinopolyspora alba]